MELKFKDIVSISGKPGLNVVIGKRPNGLIVETLDEAKKRFPTLLTHKISFLVDISMYTVEGDVKLAEVLKSLHEKVLNGLALPEKNSSAEDLKNFFSQVLPEYDQEQVYNSDIHKLVAWYKILDGKIDFSALSANESAEAGEEKIATESKKNTKGTASKPTPKTPSKPSSGPKGGPKKGGNIKAG